jgi:hypothetical protein
VTLALAAVLLPWFGAILLAVPRIPGWADLVIVAATLLLSAVLLGWDDETWGLLRLDGLAALFMVLIAGSALARRWARAHRRLRRGAADLALLGAALLVCLSADPLLSWFALAGAAAAALYPALPRGWDRVPLAGCGLGLALFGLIAEHGDPALAALAPAGLVLGYAMLAGLTPGLLIVLLALVLRLPGSNAMLLGLGLGGVLACGLGLLVAPTRGSLVRLGQGAAAAAAFGLGGPEATFAGLVQVILLVLASAAADLAARPGAERAIVAAGLAGLPPFGCFPGLALIVLATAHRLPWLLLPLGAGLGMIGWATILQLPPPRWTGPLTLAPVWIPLGLALLVGWFLPAGAADWLRATLAPVP